MKTIKIPGEKKLRPICKALGLSQKGNKNDLLQRLTKYGLHNVTVPVADTTLYIDMEELKLKN